MWKMAVGRAAVRELLVLLVLGFSVVVTVLSFLKVAAVEPELHLIGTAGLAAAVVCALVLGWLKDASPTDLAVYLAGAGRALVLWAGELTSRTLTVVLALALVDVALWRAGPGGIVQVRCAGTVTLRWANASYECAPHRNVAVWVPFWADMPTADCGGTPLVLRVAATCSPPPPPPPPPTPPPANRRVVVMDSPALAYNAKRDGSNADPIYDVLKGLPGLEFRDERILRRWRLEETVRRWNPALVVIHYSCFQGYGASDSLAREQFWNFLRYMEGTEAQFVVYSRTRNFTEMLRSDMAREAPGLAGRLHALQVVKGQDFAEDPLRSRLVQEVRVLLSIR